MTLKDAIENRETIVGEFVVTLPLNKNSITYGFTLMPDCPFFIGHVVQGEDKKIEFKNVIGFTKNELSEFLDFITLCLIPEKEEK